MKWLVVSSHDERYDFNLEIQVFEGTLEEFESSIEYYFDSEDRKTGNNGTYYYHNVHRSNKYCNNISEEVWETMKENLEVVSFHTIILIPFENLNQSDFILQHPIVNRNVKFGFLDVISN